MTKANPTHVKNPNSVMSSQWNQSEEPDIVKQMRVTLRSSGLVMFELLVMLLKISVSGVVTLVEVALALIGLLMISVTGVVTLIEVALALEVMFSMIVEILAKFFQIFQMLGVEFQGR